MGIAVEENAVCKNVFLTKQEERQEAFTQLWVRVINSKENKLLIKREDLQTNITLL